MSERSLWRRSIGDGRLHVGFDVDTREPRSLSFGNLTSTHCVVLGASGRGKTSYLALLIETLFRWGQHGCYVSSHPDLIADSLFSARRHGCRPQDIELIRPSDTQQVFHLDLLRAVPEPAHAVSLLIEAFAKAYGAATMDETPRLERTLATTFRSLIDGGLSLTEAPAFLSTNGAPLRRLLRERVADPVVRADLEEWERMSPARQNETTESARNRVARFLRGPLRLMFGGDARPLDLGSLLDRKSIMVDLSNVPPEVRRLMGTVVCGAVLNWAYRRDPYTATPRFLVADEMSEYVSLDFSRSLDSARKFGLFVTLSTQRLSGLQIEHPDLVNSILTNTGIRVLFGGSSRAEAELLAREVHTGEVNGRLRKLELHSTKFRPVQDTFDVVSDSWNESELDSDSWSEGTSLGQHDAESDGESFGLPPDEPFGTPRRPPGSE